MIKPDERHYITELPNGQFRDADPKAIKAALEKEGHRKMLQKLLQDTEVALELIVNNCEHEVTWDEQSFNWTIRTCVACGHGSLL